MTTASSYLPPRRHRYRRVALFLLVTGSTVGGLTTRISQEGIVTLPPMVSSYPAEVARLSAEQAVLRNWALLAIGLCALALGLLVAQRGLRAASQASELMAAAGEDARGLDRQRLRMVLRVLATVTSLLLAFAAIAVYMVARSHGIGTEVEL